MKHCTYIIWFQHDMILQSLLVVLRDIYLCYILDIVYFRTNSIKIWIYFFITLSFPGGGEIFRTCPDWPWGPPSLLYNGYQVFPRGKAAGAWHWPPTPI